MEGGVIEDTASLITPPFTSFPLDYSGVPVVRPPPACHPK
jgi:hypothetical protein